MFLLKTPAPMNLVSFDGFIGVPASVTALLGDGAHAVACSFAALMVVLTSCLSQTTLHLW